MKYLYSADGFTFTECDICKRVMKFRKKDIGVLEEEGVECFCGNISNTIDGMPVKESPMPAKDQPVPQKAVQQVVYAQPSGPRCPTCGSTNIQKISLASKAVGGYMFGILSSNVRNTFKCNNCGYKW